MIGESYKANFETLKRAANRSDLALMECTDKATGKPVMAVCALNVTGTGKKREFQFVPVAKLFDGNPYDELDPPSA